MPKDPFNPAELPEIVARLIDAHDDLSQRYHALRALTLAALAEQVFESQDALALLQRIRDQGMHLMPPPDLHPRVEAIHQHFELLLAKLEEVAPPPRAAGPR